MKASETIQHYKSTDMVALFDIAWEVSNGLIFSLLEQRRHAQSEDEAEVWMKRIFEVKRQRESMPSDDRLGIVAFMTAWDEQRNALNAVAAS